MKNIFRFRGVDESEQATWMRAIERLSLSLLEDERSQREN